MSGTQGIDEIRLFTGLHSSETVGTRGVSPRTRRAAAWQRRYHALLGVTGVTFVLAFLFALHGRSPAASIGSFALALVIVVTAWIVFRFGGPLDAWMAPRAARRLESAPDAPWTGDHSWNPRGETRRNERTRKVLASWLIPTMYVVVQAVGTWPRMPWLLWIAASWTIVCLFRLWHTWGRGDMRLSFAKFPFHPGGSAEVHVGLSPRGPDVHAAQFVLLRIEEDPSERRGVVLWRATHALKPGVNERALPSEHADVRLVFDIPEDAGGTCLSAPFPSYWQLEVALWTTSGFVLERFLVPIYERPRAVEAQAAGVAVAEPTR